MITDKIAIISQEKIVSLSISPSDCVKWVEEGFLKKDLAQMPAKLSVHPQGGKQEPSLTHGRTT